MEHGQNLLLIGNNYISEVLVGTATRLGIPIFSDGSLKQGPGLAVHDVPSLAFYARREATPRFYINSEECLPWITGNFSGKGINEAIGLLKDKVEFRRILADAYPDFYFRELGVHELDSFEFPEGKVLTLKPSKGFFGIGVRKVSSKEEWKASVKEVLEEVKKNSRYFSPSILSASPLLLEDFIKGKEYAVDAYYSRSKEPVIMNVYHHPYRDADDTRNVLYYTSPDIMRRVAPKATDFLKLLAKQLDLSGIAVHAEFRETENGRIIPVEVNPCRFGGFGLADLTYYGYGFNPYEYFFSQKKPDWGRILREREGLKLGWILGNNPNTDSSDLRPNHEKFRSTFSNILQYREMDHKRWPVFASVYAQSRDLKDLTKYLSVDFGQYFERIPKTVKVGAPKS